MPKDHPFRRIPTYSLGALGLIILAVFGAFYLTRSQALANKWVTHTIQVELALGTVLERTRAMEAAMRGFLFTRSPRLEDDFVVAARQLDEGVAKVARLTSDNAEQRVNAKLLREMTRQRAAYGQRTMDIMRAGGEEEARRMAAYGDGSRMTRRIARHIAHMSQIEQRLLAERGRRVEHFVWLMSVGLALTVLLVFAVAALVIADARRRYAALIEARDEAKRAEATAKAALIGREAAEAKVRQLQKMESIGQLTGGIAHDFNNMLAIVIGSLDLAERRIGADPERLLKCIRDARIGAERAATLTARLLAFSRQQPLAPEPLDANSLVGDMHELLVRTLGEHITVETQLARDLWPVFVDRGQLENAILNLALNARDAMDNGGRLSIDTLNVELDQDYVAGNPELAPGDYVMISVTDTGVGMSPGVIERAFDPFFTTKDVGKGTGLGLSQVFGFIKQSGGHVAIYSEEGAGTSIKLYLPRHMGDAPVRPARMPRGGKLPMGRPDEIILIVEDERHVRQFSADALRELGYTVLSASNGFDALAILRDRQDISLLFTDVIMPGMNGRKLADEAVAIQPGLRVLFTTGYTRNAVVHNGMLDPGVELLSKPFTITELARRVRGSLDVRSRSES